MTERRSSVALAVLVVAALTGGCAASSPVTGSRAGAARPVQLVETVPVETALGNPDLPHAKDVWVEMIRGARRSIDLEGFYFSAWPGEPLDAVVAALGDAARRGVQVRILLDRGMSATYPKPVDSLATLRNVRARFIDMRRIAGGVQHAKYFLVDGEQTFVGSQNFDWRALAHIHELGVRVRDRRVTRAFADVFEWDWQAADTTTWNTAQTMGDARGRKRPRPIEFRRLEVPIRIVAARGDTIVVWPSYSPRGWIPDSTRWDQDAILRVIDGARRELVVQLLTYAPDEYGHTDSTLDQAIRRAAGRGVRVKLLIADWVVNGKGIGWLQRLSRVPGVEVRLSTVPEWSGGYIPFARVDHCKYAVADTASTWLGTANWGPGYFLQSRNLALTFDHRPTALDARRVFESVWSSPYAAPVRADFTYPEKIRGATPPPGKKVYGN